MDRSVKMVVLAFGAALMLFLAGCGTGFPNGLLYTNITMPLVVNGGDIETYNVGEAKGTKWFGLFVFGDVSYERAKSNAPCEFGRIQRVEYFSTDFGGCGEFGIRIYGEKASADKSKNDK